MGKASWYNYIWENLVPKGYIVALLRDYQFIHMGEVNQLSLDVRYGLDMLYYESNSNSSSPIYGLLSPYSVAAGHSEGA